jgi:hypothetical protein
MAQQELADVYFAGSAKPRPLPSPTLVRVVERRPAFLWPWLFTLGILGLLLAALALNRRIFIDVDFVDAGARQARARSGAEEARRVAALDPGGFEFSQAAALASSRQSAELRLSYPGGPGPAYAAYAFRTPFDATAYVLEFEAKGSGGGEALEVVLRDRNHGTNLARGPIVPFPLGLGTDWKKARVAAERSEGFDATRIAQLRFEIGPRRTENPAGSAVWIRNVRWVSRDAEPGA